MTKRIITLLLALSMVLCVFAGCAKTETTTTSAEESAEVSQEAAQETSEAPAVEAETAAPAEDAAEAQEEAPVEEPDPNEGLVAGDIGYDWSVFQPVTETPVTLSMFYTQPPMLSAIVDVPSDMSFVYQQLEEITGVTIDFHMINMMNASTDFSLMMASGDMCDIVNDAANYYASPDQAYEEGACLDLLDYTEYTPNFNALLEEYPTIKEDLTTDAGHIVNFPNLKYPFEKKAESGLMIRQDWLDDCGITEVPVTYDEYHDALLAFKTNYDISDPYAMPYNVLSSWGMFAGGYGLTLSDGGYNLYMEGDTIALCTTSDAYYDWLSMFVDWYDTGLIGSDFMSYMSNLPDETLITTGQTGLWFTDINSIKTYENLMADADANCVLALCPDPGMDRDYSGYIGSEDDVATADNGGFSVYEGCSEPEIAMAWCDYWYNPALRQFINYGFEGETFEYDADGVPQLSGLITNNEYGLTTKLASGLYLCTSGGFMNMTEKFNTDYTELQKICDQIWEIETKDKSTVKTSGFPRGFSLSSDEAYEVSLKMADIVTYVTESALKFVTSEIKLTPDSYAEYVSTIEGMGIGDVLEIYEGAYDRYLEKYGE